MSTTIETSPSWIKLTDSINNIKGIVMVVGSSETGKSTLVNYLTQKLYCKGNRICVIDGDVGQSIIGPPGTIGLAFIKLEIEDLHLIEPDLMFFVGSISPVSHLLPAIVGLKKLAEKSIQNGMDITIINTTGFVSGEVGWEFKYQKINLIHPDHIIAIQRMNEIEDILKPFEGVSQLHIHRLAVNENVKNKSQEQRRLYREQRFKEYFQSSKVKGIPLDDILFINPYHVSLECKNSNEIQNVTVKTGDHSKDQVDNLLDLIVGLTDAEGFTIGLGKVQKIDFQKKIMHLLTPVSGSEFTKVKTIRADQ